MDLNNASTYSRSELKEHERHIQILRKHVEETKSSLLEKSNRLKVKRNSFVKTLNNINDGGMNKNLYEEEMRREREEEARIQRQKEYEIGCKVVSLFREKHEIALSYAEVVRIRRK